MMWLTPLKPSAVRLLGRPPPQGVRDFLHGKLRLLPDGPRGSALKDEMHGVIHYPLRASAHRQISANIRHPRGYCRWLQYCRSDLTSSRDNYRDCTVSFCVQASERRRSAVPQAQYGCLCRKLCPRNKVAIGS
ncbi:hypothetical protein HaLaN_03652 [Haematococcus lacustris]|uniref:Uncharacterized protein n=1 Tax=Haematococcus lacustris TaxID=44745 RepID=A0A699YL00_HAELA|nr:hypothetical protein HaLaN_03652 [Haematococcus lacustris]